MVYRSDDAVFHHELYDWLYAHGFGAQLLEIDSPFTLDYLKRKGEKSLGHAALLWQYHARREDYFGAAQVLYWLARCDDESVKLEGRLAYLSQARIFCSSQAPTGTKQKMTDLIHSIQEELDVAVIQDECMRRIKEDDRISEVKKASLISGIDTQLIGLTDVCPSPSLSLRNDLN